MTLFELMEFQTRCTLVGVDVPEPITRGLELVDVARQHAATPPKSLLEMTDEQMRDRVVEVSIRQHKSEGAWGGGTGLHVGVQTVEDDLIREIREATLPLLDPMVESLRPRFAEHAKPLEKAAQLGFDLSTHSDDVIDRPQKEIEAFRAMKVAFHGIQQIANFRITISRVFEVSPTQQELETLRDFQPGEPNYSVCFAAGDNWSAGDGFLDVLPNRARLINWTQIARKGLHLNTPTEAREKVTARQQKRDIAWLQSRGATPDQQADDDTPVEIEA